MLLLITEFLAYQMFKCWALHATLTYNAKTRLRFNCATGVSTVDVLLNFVNAVTVNVVTDNVVTRLTKMTFSFTCR